MTKPPFVFRFLQAIGVILLSLSIAMTLLGGIGTTCVAFAAENFGSMAALVPVKPVFQILVFVSIIAGIAGIFSTVRLVKARKHAYAQVLLFLLIAGVASAIQFYFSVTLRGKTAPNNMRLYITIITLVYLLILRIPGIWEKMPFNRLFSSTNGVAGGAAALCLTGLLTLTTSLWAAPTHIIDGVNTANELLAPMLIIGSLLFLSGLSLLHSDRRASLAFNQSR
jgi:hypothetical protein